jgi:arginase
MPRHAVTRRDFGLAACGLFASAVVTGGAATTPKRDIDIVLAPSNLGLRPAAEGDQQGTWRAPAALMAAGLDARLRARRVVALERPRYQVDPQPGTRIRNGHTIRSFSLEIADRVRASIEHGGFPIVVGGDCSVLLGALYGARLAGGRGLVHVDGHSDFFHPGNYDTETRLGSVAGMDLALATGRGEALLAQWPNIDGPLVRDEDAIQLGERNALDPSFDRYYGDIARTQITRLIVQDVLRMGVGEAAARVVEHLHERDLDRAWLHIDLDVLDEGVMPAVDSPGRPGLDFAQLGALIGALAGCGRIAGTTVAIFDPERDPDGAYARAIAEMLGAAFAER